VRHTGERLREAARLGFTSAIVPARSEGLDDVPASLQVTQVADVVRAVLALPSARGGDRPRLHGVQP
jgi:DNA repair protein RadA/Sms